jgi:hypothetical protein
VLTKKIGLGGFQAAEADPTRRTLGLNRSKSFYAHSPMTLKFITAQSSQYCSDSLEIEWFTSKAALARPMQPYAAGGGSPGTWETKRATILGTNLGE